MRLITHDYIGEIAQTVSLAAIGFQNGDDRLIFVPANHLLVRLAFKLLSKLATQKKVKEGDGHASQNS